MSKLSELKASHSPDMSDEDFLSMLAASNNISLVKDKDKLRVAADEEMKTLPKEKLITPEQVNQTNLGSWANRHLKEGVIRDNVHNAMDIGSALLGAPMRAQNKIVDTIEDIATPVVKWFKKDASDVDLSAFKFKVPKQLTPTTPVGKIAGLTSEVALATWFTGGAGTAVRLGTSKALAAGGKALAGDMLKTGNEVMTGVAKTIQAVKNIAIDMTITNPNDDNIAAQANAALHYPWLAAIATQPEDSPLKRRFKQGIDSLVLGELAIPAAVKTTGLISDTLGKVFGKKTAETAGKTVAEESAEEGIETATKEVDNPIEAATKELNAPTETTAKEIETSAPAIEEPVPKDFSDAILEELDKSSSYRQAKEWNKKLKDADDQLNPLSEKDAEDAAVVKAIFKHLQENGESLPSLKDPNLRSAIKDAVDKFDSALHSRLISVESPLSAAQKQTVSQSMDTFSATLFGDAADRTLGTIKSSILNHGFDTNAARRVSNLVESWAMNAKGKDETLADFFASHNIQIDSMTGKQRGMIDLPPLGTVYSKDAPLNVAIHLTQKSDESSIIHEFGHLFLWDKMDRALKGTLKEGEETDVTSIKQLLKWRPSQTQITRTQHEKFAKSFEQFFQTGTAPTGMEKVFNEFKSSMTDIYEDALVTGADLPEGFNTLFGKMLATPEDSPTMIRLYQSGVNPVKEAQAILKYATEGAKGQEGYAYAVNLGKISGTPEMVDHFVEVVNQMGKISEGISRVVPVAETEEAGMRLAPLMLSGEENMTDVMVHIANMSKVMGSVVRGGEYAMTMAGDELHVLYQALDAVADEDSQLLAKAKIFNLINHMKVIRDAVATCRGNAGRLLRQEEELVNPSAVAKDIDNALSPQLTDVVQEAAKSAKFIPIEDINSQNIGAIKQFIKSEVGDKEFNIFITRARAAGKDLTSASKVLDVFDKAEATPMNKFWGLITELYMNSILSAPVSFIRNVAGNTTVLPFAPMEYIIGGYIQKGLAAGKSMLGITNYAKEFGVGEEIGEEAIQRGADLFVGYSKFIKDAMSVGKRCWDVGEPITGHKASGVIEYNPGSWFKSDIYGIDPESNLGRAFDALGQMIDTPTKLNASVDDGFKALSARAWIYADLKHEAISKGLRNSDEIEKYVADHFDEQFIKKYKEGDLVKEIPVSQEARDFMLEQTFSQSGGMVVQDIMKWKRECPPLSLILPFVRTPANIVGFAFDHVPGISLLLSKHRKALAAGGIQQARELGRQAVGGLLLAAGVCLAMDGKITGGGSFNYAKRKTMGDLGFQSYSVHIGDKYYSFNNFDPIGMTLGIAADLAEIAANIPSDDENMTEKYVHAAFASCLVIGEQLEQKSYLEGINNILDCLNDPQTTGVDKGLNIIANIMGGFVPRCLQTGLRDTGLVSQNMKETSDMLERLKRQIPGLSDTLPDQNSWLTGEARKYADYSSINALPAKQLPEGTTEDTREELLRMEHVLGAPKKEIKGVKLSSEQYSRYCQLHGTLTLDEYGGKNLMGALTDAINSQDYQNAMSEHERAKTLKAIIGHYRAAAANALTEEDNTLSDSIDKVNATTSDDVDALAEYGE